jgi:hypothetical protein
MEPVARSFSAEFNEALSMAQGQSKDKKLCGLINQCLRQNDLNCAWNVAKKLSPEKRPQVFSQLVHIFCEKGETKKADKIADRLFGKMRRLSYENIILTLIKKGEYKGAAEVYLKKYLEEDRAHLELSTELFRNVIEGFAKSSSYEETVAVLDLSSFYPNRALEAAIEGFCSDNRFGDALRLFNEERSRFNRKSIADLVTQLICHDQNEEAFGIIDKIDLKEMDPVVRELQSNFYSNQNGSALSRLVAKLPQVLRHPIPLNLLLTFYLEEGKSDAVLALFSGDDSMKLDRDCYKSCPDEFKKTINLITEHGVVYAKQGDMVKVKAFAALIYSLHAGSVKVGKYTVIKIAYLLSNVKLPENIALSPLEMLISLIPEAVSKDDSHKMTNLFFYMNENLKASSEKSHPYCEELKAELKPRIPEHYRPSFLPARSWF